MADDAVVKDYDRLFAVRAGVLPLLEAARRDKLIGKSLEAKVLLGVSGAMKELLGKYKDVLPELFIVSQVELSDAPGEKALAVAEGAKAEVLAASGNKCPRCWTFRPEVGAQELCRRCVEAVS